MSIKRHFVSKSPNGWLIEFDYKQLEIRVLALATNCAMLIKDINSGTDMHTARASEIFIIPLAEVTKEQRKLAKGFSFQLQYGASVKSIAKFWNVKEELVEKFFTAYFTRYPELHEWYKNITSYVQYHSNYNGDDLEGQPVKRSIIPSIWDDTGNMGGFFITENLGQLYSGPSGKTSPSGKYTAVKRAYFPPTKIKNYPIQGGAADILLLVLNRMRKILPRWEEHVHIILQVHDSILFDWHGDNPVVDSFVNEIKDLMESVPEIIFDIYGIRSPVEFPVDVTYGKNWGDRRPYQFVV